MNAPYREAQGESAHDQTMGTNSANRVKGYFEEADKARKSIGTVGVMRQLQDVTVTGPGTDNPLMQAGKKALIASGFASPETVAAFDKQQLFQALATQNTMQMLGGSVGAGTSNSDVEFVNRMTANTGNDPKVNKALLGAQEKLADRSQAIAIEAARWEKKYAKQGGTLYGTNEQGQTWDEHLKQWAEEHPLFDGGFLKQYGLGDATDLAAGPATTTPVPRRDVSRY